MNQPPNQPPRRPTGPLPPRGTRPLGDAFVSSAHGAQGRGTGSLRGPTGPLGAVVPRKIAEARGELGYIKHLLDLFAPSIVTLRYSDVLAPHEAVAAEAIEQSRLEASRGKPPPGNAPPAAYPPWSLPFSDRQGAFALRMADVLRRGPKVRQRAQVALYQYDEAMRAYQEGVALVDRAEAEPVETAWSTLEGLALERIKGKAYPISVFYEQFKGDPILNQLFPAPQGADVPTSAARTQPLSTGDLRVQDDPATSGSGEALRAITGDLVNKLPPQLRDRANELVNKIPLDKLPNQEALRQTGEALKEKGTDALNKLKGFLKRD